jgi:hypothetical protein
MVAWATTEGEGKRELLRFEPKKDWVSRFVKA